MSMANINDNQQSMGGSSAQTVSVQGSLFCSASKDVCDAKVITHASGGRALRAMSMIPSSKIITSVQLPPLGKQMLLDPPRDSSLMAARKTAYSIVYCCLTSEESLAFRNDVMEKGWSIAAEVHADKLWVPFHDLGVLSVQGSSGWKKHHHNTTEEKLSMKVSEACITQCAYIPMKSFQIPRSKMALCEAAMATARKVKNPIDADKFLKAYSSFVSENLYHLGGVFFREVTIKCTERTTLLELMNKALAEMKGGTKVSLLIGAEASGNRMHSSSSTSMQSSSLKVEQMKEEVIILGPTSAKDEDEFRHRLEQDPLSWAIIDKDMDQEDDLVGVWDLLLQHVQLPGDAEDDVSLKRAAKSLCERWQDYASAVDPHNPHLPSWDSGLYSKLISQNKLFVAKLSSDPMLREPQGQQLPSRRLQRLSSLAHVNVSLADLPQRLQGVVEEAATLGIDHIDLGPDTAQLIKSCITNLRTDSTKPAESESALQIFKHYGFDVAGNILSELYSHQVKSMISELKEIQKPPSPKPPVVPAYTWKHARMGSIIPSGISASETSHSFSYIGDVVVDRAFHRDPYASHGGSQHAGPFSQAQGSQQAACILIDCLRHRMSPLQHLLEIRGQASPAAVDNWDCAFEDEEEEEEEEEEKQHHVGAVKVNQKVADVLVSPFQILMQIMQGSDLPAQVAICKLLLDQRAATPLVLPKTQPALSPHEDDVVPGLLRLTHYVQALCFVQVGLAKEQKVCIAEDTNLPRVVFLSNKKVQDSHAAIVASRALNCDFTSQHYRRDMSQLITPAVEVGVGFVSHWAQGESDPLACLAFHVAGPYDHLIGFVDAIADMVVLELEQGSEHPPMTLTSAVVLRWQETDVKEYSDKKRKMIWGQESYVVGEVRKFLYTASQKMHKTRRALTEVCTVHFPPYQLICFEEPKSMLCQCDFITIKEKLILQRSFSDEARAHFELLQLKDNPGEQRVKENICKQYRKNRSMLATQVVNNPMVQLFYELLSQCDATSRRVGMMWLERTISERMYPILEKASLRTDTTFEAFQRSPKDPRAKEKYIKAKQEYVEKNLGVDNLWRELCHIFEADPRNQRDLAKKAAQHLLDGFPLEILDGDAGMFCKAWVETVLIELDTMTKKKFKGKSARIFVLSVMGLQSSGKSTVLNLMFGTQLQTSAGRCTRGVYIQLVPSERAEYDYVMLLDTEGIRSPEYFGLESSEVRDNRLATFGLLPADASIFMVSNEDDSGLKEVLPMVLLAFKGSAVAERCGGRIRAKMVFVYRSVDTNDKKKLKGNKKKLQEYLREAAEQVANMGFSFTEEEDLAASDLLQTVFTDFRVDEDEEKSDVKCMGSLKKGCVPPGDTPDWVYGERVVELREYIHKRVTEDRWIGIGLKEWAEHLTRVWECVCSADFELSFKSALEYSSYRELQEKLRWPRMELGKRYLQEFEALEKKMRSMTEDENTLTLFHILEANVEDLVRSTSREVARILGIKMWAKWRAQELKNWEIFCANTKVWYEKRIDDMVNGVVKFEKVVTDYEKQIKERIVHMMEAGTWTVSDESTSMKQRTEVNKEKFEEIFQSILRRAEQSHPPITNQIPKNVTDRYQQSGGLAKRFNLYGTSKKSPVVPEQKATLVGNIWNRIANKPKNSNKQQELYSDLQGIIDHQLRDAKQYWEVIVDNVIKQTTDLLEKQSLTLSRDDQGEAHSWVKATLTERMQEIQRRWDEDHNVAEKLRVKAKPRLYEFFEARAQGLEAASMLITELQHILEDELVEAHSVLVVKKVTAKLVGAEWVMNWKVMRACLDLHLLTLVESKKRGNTNNLLRFVADGSFHFQALTSALISEAISTEVFEQEWKRILQLVERCLTEQSSASPSVDLFLNELALKLDTYVDPSSKLSSSVVSSIHSDLYKNHILDGDFYQKKVPGMCENLRKKLHPDLEKVREKMIESVRERMMHMKDESVRPRCKESCPRCRITCFHPMGHAEKHDAIHQPEGVSGGFWIISNELVSGSCTDQLIEKARFLHKDTSFPYQEFEKVYPSWINPSNKDKIAVEVREYIFFNYQDELVKFHSTQDCVLKPCPPRSMPQHYNHDIDLLRNSLQNRLQVIFSGGDDAENRFLQLLQSV